MVGYVVKNDVDVVLVGGCKERVQHTIRTETFVHLCKDGWPVAVVSGELGVFATCIVFIAMQERIASPSVPRVLRDRRNPQRVNA